jgi:hypothetical protein
MTTIYKPIKFFLNVGDVKIRSLEELRKSADFHLDYLYDLYKDGILENWLKVHEYQEEYEAIKKVPKDELNEKNAFDFCTVLRPGLDRGALELYSNNLIFKKKWNEYFNSINANKEKVEEIVNDYHSGFDSLKESIKNDASNMSKIKIHLTELSSRYLPLFLLNPDSFIDYLEKYSPIAILQMMCNEVLRKQIESIRQYNKIIEYIHSQIKATLSTPIPFEYLVRKNFNLKDEYVSRLCAGTDIESFTKIVNESIFLSAVEREKLLQEVLQYSKNSTNLSSKKNQNSKFYKFIFNENKMENNFVTLIRTVQSGSNSWDDPVLDSLKKYIILYCPPKAEVRPYKVVHGELDQKQLRTLPIIKGFEYRSSNKEEYLIYMEI